MRNLWHSSIDRFWWRGSGPVLCPRCRSARWKFAPCLYIVLPRQSSIVAFQNLEGCVAFPIKPPKIMHRFCFRHYVCMLWHRQTGFGDCLDRGLCSCPFFVLVAVQIFLSWYEIHWQKGRLCPVTLRKSNIPIDCFLSLINFYIESEVEDLIFHEFLFESAWLHFFIEL